MTVRVFQDQTGFFFCTDTGPLDTRGQCCATAAEATREAVRWMQSFAPYDDTPDALVGSGVDRRVAKSFGVKVLD